MKPALGAAGRADLTEVEWEVAAVGSLDATGTELADEKRRYPWGRTSKAC